jgi:phosphatidylinositol alpha-mannosyltransferase
VVASRLSGYANVARDGEDAVLVPPGDAHALAAALGDLLADARRRSELTASGERRAASFSMDRLAERYLDIYDRARHTARAA